MYVLKYLSNRTESTLEEIDDTSIGYARNNVAENGLQDKISVIPADPNGPIFAPLTQRCVCSISFGLARNVDLKEVMSSTISRCATHRSTLTGRKC